MWNTRKHRSCPFPSRCFTSTNAGRNMVDSHEKSRDASLIVFTLNQWYLNASPLQPRLIIVITGCTCQKYRVFLSLFMYHAEPCIPVRAIFFYRYIIRKRLCTTVHKSYCYLNGFKIGVLHRQVFTNIGKFQVFGSTGNSIHFHLLQKWF